jgi:AcrR family transcriptional regulator
LFAARVSPARQCVGLAAEAGVDAALIHHYFENKEQLFLATVALPLEMPQKLEEVAAGGLDGIGERLVRTVLVSGFDLQPSLIAAIRTTLTDPALTRSVGEFSPSKSLAMCCAGTTCRGGGNRRAGLAASQVLGLVIGRYVLQLPLLVSVAARTWSRGRAHRPEVP